MQHKVKEKWGILKIFLLVCLVTVEAKLTHEVRNKKLKYLNHKCDSPLLHSLSKSLFLLFSPNVYTHFLNTDNEADSPPPPDW